MNIIGPNSSDNAWRMHCCSFDRGNRLLYDLEYIDEEERYDIDIGSTDRWSFTRGITVLDKQKREIRLLERQRTRERLINRD
jgi:hypothetical protein